MTNFNETLNANFVANALFHFGRGGHPGGSFTSTLFSAFERADMRNRAKLASVFPEEHAAWLHVRDDN